MGAMSGRRNYHVVLLLLIFALVALLSLNFNIDQSFYMPGHSADAVGPFPNSNPHHSNSTLGIGKIYVINLPERIEKRSDYFIFSEYYGIDIDFVEADNGKALKFLEKIPRAMRALDESEFARTFSHLKTMESFYDDNLETALVLEDDIDLPLGFRDEFKSVLESLPLEWDIIFLQDAIFNGMAKRSQLLIPGQAVKQTAKPPVRIRGYLLNRSGAKKILTFAEDIIEKFDIFLFKFSQSEAIKTFMTTRAIVTNRAEYIMSDVSGNDVQAPKSSHELNLDSMLNHAKFALFGGPEEYFHGLEAVNRDIDETFLQIFDAGRIIRNAGGLAPYLEKEQIEQVDWNKIFE